MIKLENATRTYRMGKVEIQALRGVNLTIGQGEMVAIIGASGSGKSTLMNTIGFLDKLSSGRYLFEGNDVSQLNDDQLAELRNKKIGFVFQDFNLLRRADAVSNVELPIVYAGGQRKRQRALEALARVGLAARANHKPTELSGGEQQRVAIARALVNNPALVLADEPTGNLDTASSADIVALFRKLNDEGITVVMITHEMEIAQQARRIIRLRDGQLIGDEVLARSNETLE
jgi:putative ABC transport system ATP-binding protein